MALYQWPCLLLVGAGGLGLCIDGLLRRGECAGLCCTWRQTVITLPAKLPPHEHDGQQGKRQRRIP